MALALNNQSLYVIKQKQKQKKKQENKMIRSGDTIYGSLYLEMIRIG